MTPADRVVLSGLDETAAEMFVYRHRAALRTKGRWKSTAPEYARSPPTRNGSSLDRFGIVTILLDTMVAANLALPLTSRSIRCRPRRSRVRRGRGRRGPGSARRTGHERALSDEARLRTPRPCPPGPARGDAQHPTAALDQAAGSARFGETLRAFSNTRGFGWIDQRDRLRRGVGRNPITTGRDDWLMHPFAAGGSNG